MAWLERLAEQDGKIIVNRKSYLLGLADAIAHGEWNPEGKDDE